MTRKREIKLDILLVTVPIWGAVSGTHMISPRPSRQAVRIVLLPSRPILHLKIIFLEPFKPTGHLSLGFLKGRQPSLTIETDGQCLRKTSGLTKSISNSERK